MSGPAAKRWPSAGVSEAGPRWGMSAVLFVALGLALVGWRLGSPAVTVAGPVALLIVVRERRRRRLARRHRLLLEQLVQIVDHLTLATRSGAGLASALAELDTARFGRPAVGPAAIAPMVDAVRRHRPVAEAASLLLHAADRPVRLIGATLHTAGRSGGPVGSGLVGLRHTLVGIVHGEDRRLAESTQALTSAAMLSVIPIGFATLAAVADREVAAFYLRDTAGAACLLGSIGLGYGGWIWMRRQVDRPAVAARRVRQRRSRGEREAAALEELVGTIEMAAAVVGAGGTIGDALDSLALHGPDGVVSTFARVAERRRSGLILVDALAPAADELGPTFHPFVGAMLLSVSGGAPVGSFLQRLGDDADTARRRSADIRARRLSIGLLPPLVLCHLPALVIGALAPVVIVAVGRLGR